jgi:1,4-alpha-glucan branching enzyme
MELNRLYRSHPALYQVDFSHTGFEWIDISDIDQSVIAFLRRAVDPSDYLVFACNFTPLPRGGYKIGVPAGGFYREILNSDSEQFGGSNVGNLGGVTALQKEHHGRPFSITVTLPPMAVLAFQPEREKR